jgi:hypothetical protein
MSSDKAERRYRIGLQRKPRIALRNRYALLPVAARNGQNQAAGEPCKEQKFACALQPGNHQHRHLLCGLPVIWPRAVDGVNRIAAIGRAKARPVTMGSLPLQSPRLDITADAS